MSKTNFRFIPKIQEAFLYPCSNSRLEQHKMKGATAVPLVRITTPPNTPNAMTTRSSQNFFRVRMYSQNSDKNSISFLLPYFMAKPIATLAGFQTVEEPEQRTQCSKIAKGLWEETHPKFAAADPHHEVKKILPIQRPKTRGDAEIEVDGTRLLFTWVVKPWRLRKTNLQAAS